MHFPPRTEILSEGIVLDTIVRAKVKGTVSTYVIVIVEVLLILIRQDPNNR